jgi:hypothetical protein
MHSYMISPNNINQLFYVLCLWQGKANKKLFIWQLNTTPLRNESESSYSLPIHSLGSCRDKCLSSASGSFTLGKVPEYMGLGGSQGRRGDVEKKLTCFAWNRAACPVKHVHTDCRKYICDYCVDEFHAPYF